MNLPASTGARSYRPEGKPAPQSELPVMDDNNWATTNRLATDVFPDADRVLVWHEHIASVLVEMELKPDP